MHRHMAQPQVVVLGRGPGSKRFKSKTEAISFLQAYRNGPEECPFRVPEAELAWLVPMFYRHPKASKLLRDWDGQTVWVAPDEVHEREVRVFQVQTTLGGMVTISGHECISGVSNDVALGRASRAAEARRERAAAAQEDAAADHRHDRGSAHHHAATAPEAGNSTERPSGCRGETIQSSRAVENKSGEDCSLNISGGLRQLSLQSKTIETLQAPRPKQPPRCS